MKPWAEAFYKSAGWQKCRAAYIAERLLIDGGLCEECHERVGVIVHHKETLTELNIGDPEITLNHELLELGDVVCDAGDERGAGVQGVSRSVRGARRDEKRDPAADSLRRGRSAYCGDSPLSPMIRVIAPYRKGHLGRMRGRS